MGKGEPDTKSIQSTASQNTTSSLHSKKQGGFLTRMMSRRSKSRGSFDIETGVPPGHFRKGSASKAAGEYVSTSSKRGNVMECPLCLMERPKDQFPDIITCEHRSCQECLRQYLKIEITESRVNIACPECAEVFHPNDIKRILNDNMLMSKYEEFALRRVLMMDPDCRWCPAPDCGYAVIAAGCASCPEVACQRTGCNTSFCYHCKQIWHPNQTCDAARQQRSGRIRKSSLSCSQGSISHQVKPCPRCTALIIKMDDGSCNHMTCAVCGAEFCWLCMKEISDLHYLSPSGCTFWGKKPWSRKKKILWQLGTLVGAPVGIALIAGIAVPAMIIGIPVYVGRKVYWKYSNASKHRRNIAIFGSVSLSIVAAPVLAALTVGIGVPIMLTYVYGVVPFSLCRSGGCGVTTSHSGGVRIEFDNDNDVTVGVTNASDINPEVNSAVGNSSIGEASVARESQLEVVGILHDDTVSDSASTRAIAGSSLTGSLSGSGSVGPSVIGQNKLDVHIEVSSKRCSLSSESASLYLPDNSSMTAMAGSISEEKGVTNISSYVDGHAEMLDKITKSRHSSGGSSNVEISQGNVSVHNPWEPNLSHKGAGDVNTQRVGGMKKSKGRSRHSKKNSVKISDHVVETSYRDNDSINDSIHSELSGNMADSETPSECSSSLVGDICTGSEDKHQLAATTEEQRSNSADSSNSSVTNHQTFAQEPISGMTEVENDKPTNHLNMLPITPIVSTPKATLMSTDL